MVIAPLHRTGFEMAGEDSHIPVKKNVKVQLDLVVCIIILQRISEELEFIFSLKFCIHHQEISMG